MTDSATQSPQQWYREACERAGFVCDVEQLAAIGQLETLW